MCNNLLINSKRQFFQTKVENGLSSDPKKSWKFIGALLGNSSSFSGNTTFTQIYDGTTCYNTPASICNAFITYFMSAIDNISNEFLCLSTTASPIPTVF